MVSGALAVAKITVGLAGHSTAVVADGLESAGDVLAAKLPGGEHPYGHGRSETLAATGVLISAASFEHPGQPRLPLAAFVVWPLAVSALAKAGLASFKFR